MPIPKLIHQTYFKKTDLPKAIQVNILTLKKLNPEWQYTLYDDQDIVDFIKHHYEPDVLKLYNKINPLYGAARADLFRYLLIYKLGGAYFDIKSAARIPLEQVIDGKDYVLAHWLRRPAGLFGGDEAKYPRGEYQQWHVIGTPEHPFLKAVIDKVLGNIEDYSVSKFGTGKRGTILTTGPVPYTQAIHPLVGSHSHKLYLVDRDAHLYYTTMWGPGHHRLFGGNNPHYSRLRSPVVYHTAAEKAAYEAKAANEPPLTFWQQLVGV